MDKTNLSESERSKNGFDALSFERKLVELVEEVRLRRTLESENEKTLKSVLDEKYQTEIELDDQNRRHQKQKDEFEQQISLLKRKLEDKICVSDDEKAKQQLITGTYSQEIRVLKEELRAEKCEKLNLIKKIQELEGKMKLHNNFQEAIVREIEEIRRNMKSLIENCKELTATQKKVLTNVSDAKITMKKYDLYNQHLQQSISIVEKTNAALKRQLVLSKSECTTIKNSIQLAADKPVFKEDTEKLQQKILELENKILLSRKENENTLNNFLESNKLLCQFMDKFSEVQEREASTVKVIDRYLNEIQSLKERLQAASNRCEGMKKERENRCSIETQTEDLSNFEMSSRNEIISLAEFKQNVLHNSEEVNLHDMNQFSENTVSEIRKKKVSFSDTLTTEIKNRTITFSEILKRKIHVIEDGEKYELMKMKSLRTDHNSNPDMQLTVENSKGILKQPSLDPNLLLSVTENGNVIHSDETRNNELESFGSPCDIDEASLYLDLYSKKDEEQVKDKMTEHMKLKKAQGTEEVMTSPESENIMIREEENVMNSNLKKEVKSNISLSTRLIHYLQGKIPEETSEND